MTAIEDRITAVLERHKSPDGFCFTWSCACGADFHDDSPTSTGGSHLEHVGAAVVAELQPALGELEAIKLLLAATREQLSRTIADFCAVRDAMPRKQVEQILASVQAEAESSEEPNVNVVYDCHNDGDLDEVWLGYRLDERRRREDGI